MHGYITIPVYLTDLCEFVAYFSGLKSLHNACHSESVLQYSKLWRWTGAGAGAGAWTGAWTGAGTGTRTWTGTGAGAGAGAGAVLFKGSCLKEKNKHYF